MTGNLLTADQVAARLGVKRETVYAYVSRGLLGRTVADDGRTSHFDASEVEQLARRGRPRAGRGRVGSVEVSMATTITGIAQDRLVVRGHDVVDLVAGADFEAVAELLWRGRLPDGGVAAPWPELDPAVRATVRGVARLLPPAAPAAERFATTAAAVACGQPSRVDLRPDVVIRHARTLVTSFVESLPHGDRRPDAVEAAAAAAAGRRRTPARALAARLWPRLSPLPATAARVAVLDAALILLADHELATSTLAARVAASTRADPYAVVLAGLGAVSGPLHGKAALEVHRLVRAAGEVGPDAAVAEAAARGRIPGVGHPVYRGTDPRATCLLDRLRAITRASDRRRIEAVAAAATLGSNREPNVDFALGCLAHVADMPVGATEAIFATARTAGWIAHALEEYGESPLRFRARAIYVGDRPGDPPGTR